MSFSSEVKEELSGQLDSARHCRIAFLAALFHMAPVLTEDSIGIRTDQAGTAQAFGTVLKKVVSAPVSTLKRPKGKSFEVTVTVSGKDQVKNLLEAMKYDRAGDPASLPISLLSCKVEILYTQEMLGRIHSLCIKRI